MYTITSEPWRNSYRSWLESGKLCVRTPLWTRILHLTMIATSRVSQLDYANTNYIILDIHSSNLVFPMIKYYFFYSLELKLIQQEAHLYVIHFMKIFFYMNIDRVACIKMMISNISRWPCIFYFNGFTKWVRHLKKHTDTHDRAWLYEKHERTSNTYQRISR